MTNLTQYEKGCSPSAIQRKYGLTYEQGYELAERLKKIQELELEVRRENTKLKTENKWYSEQLNEASKEIEKLKELLKRIRKELSDCPTCVEGSWKAELVDKIDELLGEE